MTYWPLHLHTPAPLLCSVDKMKSVVVRHQSSAYDVLHLSSLSKFRYPNKKFNMEESLSSRTTICYVEIMRWSESLNLNTLVQIDSPMMR